MTLAICNVGRGGWYPRGSERLRRYCEDAGYPLEFLVDDEPFSGCPYVGKMRHVLSTLDRYDEVLWLDCSVVPLRPVREIVDYVRGHESSRRYGVWAYRTGMTVGETCNDKAFARAALPRTTLTLPEWASTMFYLNVKHPCGLLVADTLEYLLDSGAAEGSRQHNPRESKRKEFRFHRQDQSCLTLAMHSAGVDPDVTDVLWETVKYADDDRDVVGKLAVVAGGEENLACYPYVSVAA